VPWRYKERRLRKARGSAASLLLAIGALVLGLRTDGQT
jgi:hypothetical protein